MGSDTVDLGPLRRLSEIDRDRAKLKLDDDALKRERAGLEQQVMAIFEQIGQDNFRIDGRTVYLHRQWWAKAVNGDQKAACAALKAEPATRDLVRETFNTQQLSAFCRERVKDHQEPIFGSLVGAIEFNETVAVRSRG